MQRCFVLLLAACNTAPGAPTIDAGPDAVAPSSPMFVDLLLRQPAPPRLVRGNTAFDAFGAIPCCMTFAPGGVPTNSRWPLASEAWMDYTSARGANFFHFRMGPFYGDATHETEWADIGGPYLADGGWNTGFWDKVRALAWHAGSLAANVEVVVVDTWYCKHAQIGFEDQQMPWAKDEIEACGRYASVEQERFIRKVVAELGCFANLTWLTDNEGGLISGTTRAWYEWVHSVIRDEEQRSGCGVVHLIGTNYPAIADGPFDFVATHTRAELTTPIAGKHTENNEHNPAYSPNQEYVNFCFARNEGLHWWLWRAEMSDDDFETTLSALGAGCPLGGP